MAALRALVVGALAAACGSSTPRTAQHRAAPGDDITLYRDVAVVRQRVTLELPAMPTTVTVELANGVAADQITLLDRGGVTVTGIHARTDPPDEDRGVQAGIASADTEGEGDDREGSAEPPPPITLLYDDDPDPRNEAARIKVVTPTTLRLDVAAPRAGTYALVIGYTTDKLHWDVAYTMTATPSRDRGELRGALAIRNESGIAFHAESARVIDSELAAWRGKTAEHLAASLVGGTHGSTLPAAPRELGAMTLGNGETRVDLVRDASRRLRSVLVYDPIGTKLDNPGPAPLRDIDLGLRPRASTRVTESFEVARDARATAGLPGGPVRLLDRGTDGSLAVLGEARLFDAATRVSEVDTIAVGTAEDVIGTRERREITVDEDNHRIVEEFMITLDNKRAIPVEVLVREHLYRGQNWVLAYHSAPEASKEGPQQISLRTYVPARTKTKLLYVVVYTWNQ
jgi:hypothetical protein